MHFARNISIKYRWLLTLLVLLGVGGCQSYRNFTTYFNVIYDARRHLETYEEKLAENPGSQSGAVATVTVHRWLDEEYETRRIYIRRNGMAPEVKLQTQPQTAVANRTGNQKHLDSAIILGSKVLADKHQSEFIEDALYLIGKAMYYKNDYSGAKRKFNELLYKYPNTEYAPEVGMLLARTLVSAKQLDTAETAVLRAAAVAGKDKNTAADVHRLYAELLAAKYPDSLARAAGELKKAEELSEGNDAARLAYERGALFYLDGNWDEAEKAFGDAISKAGDAFLEGEARIAHAQALMRLRKFDEAQTELDGVLAKTRFGSNYPPAHFQLTVNIEEEARAASRNQIRDVAFRKRHYDKIRSAYFALDTAYRNISQAIMARSRYRQAEFFRDLAEYDSAARIANLIIGTKDFSSPEMNDIVNERLRALVRFAEQKIIAERTQKIEKVVERSRQTGVSLAVMNEREIRIEAERNVAGARYRPDTPPTFTPEEEEQVKKQIELIRKRREAEGNPLAALRISDTVRFIDSLRLSRAKAHYELGRAYETFEEPSMSIYEYQQALDVKYLVIDTPKRTFQAQVYFAHIQLTDQLKQYEERDSLITLLMTEYGETVFAGQAARLFGGKRGADSPGERAYASAYNTFRASGLAAKQAMLDVAAKFNHEDVAPRALYAIGLAFEEAGRYDSAIVYYRRTLNEYPFSQYAELLKPRLAANTAPVQTIVKQQKPSTIQSAPEGTGTQEVPVDRDPLQQPPVQIPPQDEPEENE